MSLPAGMGTLRGRAPEWERLRELMAKSQRGLGTLSEAELWELPSLYRKTISDLSLLRSRGADPQLEQELSSLCNAAHALIYQSQERTRGVGLWRYISAELPRAVRRRRGYVLAAAAVMALFTVIGWVHARVSPQLAETVLPAQIVSGMETSLRTARKQADLKLAAQIEPQERNAAAVAITLNNIAVSLKAFLLGIFGGVFTIFALAFNGYMLGVIAYIYFHTDPGIAVNLPLYFIAGIAPHGAIELPAICLAGGAGMLLGLSWVFPGQRGRGDALREAATDAWRIALACICTLLVAGSIEGFITPLLPPEGFPIDLWYWCKIGVGVAVFSAWLCWLMLGGRSREKA